MKQKKAFSLSEALFTLIIVSVGTMLMIPVLTDIMPDQEQILFTKAFRDLERATANIISDPTRYDQNPNATEHITLNQTPLSTARCNVGQPSFCCFVAEQMNVVGSISCGTGLNFRGTNGACYRNIASLNNVQIDTKCSGNTANLYVVSISNDGGVTIPSGGVSSLNQCKAQKWLKSSKTLNKREVENSCR